LIAVACQACKISDSPAAAAGGYACAEMQSAANGRKVRSGRR